MRSGKLNTVCLVQQKSTSVDDDYGTQIETWTEFARVWCEKVDMLPSRSEAVTNQLNVNTNQSRIRMKFRSDIDSTMRFLIGTMIYQIVSGPAEIGHKDLIEFVAERYSA